MDVFSVDVATAALLILALAVCFVSLVSRKRDSRYYHWMSAAIAPLTRKYQAQYKVDEPAGLSVRAFDAASLDKDWKWYQPELVSSHFSDKALVIDSRAESVWYRNLRGPMLYRYFCGDGELSANVKTRKSTDRDSYPDTQWQFGGIIFRDPAGDACLARENYLFAVVGYRHQALQVEIKSTRMGRSDVSAIDWSSGDAQLLIQRRGDSFTLSAKLPDDAGWQVMGEYIRPDMPPLLQVGIIVYAFSEGRGIYDLSVQFDSLEIRPLKSVSD